MTAPKRPGRPPRQGRGAPPARPPRGAPPPRPEPRPGGAAGLLADPDLLSGRLFFAVPVPGHSREPLEAVLPELDRALPARWTNPSGWHLTLAFLGHVRPEFSAEVGTVGEGAVAGLGPGRLRLAACKQAGLRFEEREHQPHLTLARLPSPGPVPEQVLDLVSGAVAASPPWEARELCCYRSTLTNRGARYQVVRTFPLTRTG